MYIFEHVTSRKSFVSRCEGWGWCSWWREIWCTKVSFLG